MTAEIAAWGGLVTPEDDARLIDLPARDRGGSQRRVGGCSAPSKSPSMATPGQQWTPPSTAYLRSSSRSAGPPKAPGHDLGSDPAAGPGPPGLRPQSWRSPALERRLPSSRRGAAVSPGARHHPSTFALVLSDRPRGEPGECGARRVQKPRLGGPPECPLSRRRGPVKGAPSGQLTEHTGAAAERAAAPTTAQPGPECRCWSDSARLPRIATTLHT